MTHPTYKSTGVNREIASRTINRIKDIAVPTYGPQVLRGIGGFGSMYRLSGYQNPVLVSSTDGVGTKIKIAAAMNMYEGLGEDVVNACVNDVASTGAQPLFFLDYIASGKLVLSNIEAMAKGMAKACRAAGCALIGGETAEMPGIYREGDFDLVGFIVGVMESDSVDRLATICEGDFILGIPSSGLHTNGFSLVRSALELDVNTGPLREFVPELGMSLGKALLETHRPYYPLIEPAVELVKGMAHITGGGLVENIPRILPSSLGARLDISTWEVPPIFNFIHQRSNIEMDEMYRVFNMGLGMVMVCEKSHATDILTLVPESRIVGEIVTALGNKRLEF